MESQREFWAVGHERRQSYGVTTDHRKEHGSLGKENAGPQCWNPHIKSQLFVQRGGSQKFLSLDLEHFLPVSSVDPWQVDFYKDIFGC